MNTFQNCQKRINNSYLLISTFIHFHIHLLLFALFVCFFVCVPFGHQYTKCVPKFDNGNLSYASLFFTTLHIFDLSSIIHLAHIILIQTNMFVSSLTYRLSLSVHRDSGHTVGHINYHPASHSLLHQNAPDVNFSGLQDK